MIDKWNNAQVYELGYWKYIMENGIVCSNVTSDKIYEFQRKNMLETLLYSERPIEFWKDKIIIEFGSGPLGVCEFIDDKEKIAIEPLINEYRKIYNHLQESDVIYLDKCAEGPLNIPDGYADLVVSINMLDHVIDPLKVLNEINRICKTNGYFLFHVNVYLSESDINKKSGMHLDLHPHSFTKIKIFELLESYNLSVIKFYCCPEPNEQNEHHFICFGVKKKC